MRASSVRFWSLVLAFSCPVVAEAAQVVLILRPGGTSWQAQEAERITFNDKDKLRTGSSQKTELRGEEYKKLPVQAVLRGSAVLRHAGGYFVVKNGANWNPVLPDGASVKGSVSYADLWSSAKITIQKDRDKKSMASVRPEDLFAVIPGADTNEALSYLLTDEANFKGLGEKDAKAAFDEWKSALVALAPSATGQASTRIQQKLLSEMQSAAQRLRNGIANKSDLDLGLQYVAISKSVYPQEESQEKARVVLEQTKIRLDQRIAILRAFSAASLWDAFLDKYGDFARWDNSFDELKKLQERAYIECANEHRTKGLSLEKAGQYPLALKEAQMAQHCRPGDQGIATWVETLSISEAQTAVRRPNAPVDPNSPKQIKLRDFLLTADRSMTDKLCDEAEIEINKAVDLDKESPSILFSQAKLAQCRGELLKALEILNQYDRRVTAGEDRRQSEHLRTDINYDLRKAKRNLKGEIAEARAKGDYVQASAIAEKGVSLDGNDLDFLLEAGLSRAILRKTVEAEGALNAYLRLSQGPGIDAKKRQEVYNLVSRLKETIPEPQGTPNWFSGYKSPPDAFYCPISLMPNARPLEVRASRKQTTTYQWNRDALSAVHVITQLPGEADFTAYFDYFADGKSVRRVSTEAIPEGKDTTIAPLRFTSGGPVGEGKGVYTALLNNPVADPLMIEKLTGTRVAAIVAGNPYFHPFAWTGVYLFIAEYDNQGRVKSAKEVLTAQQKGEQKESAHDFEFRWEGLRLLEILERGTGGYRRTMTYSGPKLVSETIVYKGKDSKIEYKYKGNELLEASCTDDWSIDGRSRHVTFR
jgi:hypothetical protein